MRTTPYFAIPCSFIFKLSFLQRFFLLKRRFGGKFCGLMYLRILWIQKADVSVDND